MNELTLHILKISQGAVKTRMFPEVEGPPEREEVLEESKSYLRPKVPCEPEMLMRYGLLKEIRYELQVPVENGRPSTSSRCMSRTPAENSCGTCLFILARIPITNLISSSME